jgi:ssDNA-binding Zn-finger/Zn-ribbon topoisomerase 1
MSEPMTKPIGQPCPDCGSDLWFRMPDALWWVCAHPGCSGAVGGYPKNGVRQRAPSLAEWAADLSATAQRLKEE